MSASSKDKHLRFLIILVTDATGDFSIFYPRYLENLSFDGIELSIIGGGIVVWIIALSSAIGLDVIDIHFIDVVSKMKMSYNIEKDRKCGMIKYEYSGDVVVGPSVVLVADAELFYYEVL